VAPKTAAPSVREAADDRNGTASSGSYKTAALSPALSYAPAPVKQAHTNLIGFENSAFPYSGKSASPGGRYSDNRVLVHMPAGFEVRKPAAIIVFFHGHGDTLARDVRDRPLVPP